MQKSILITGAAGGLGKSIVTAGIHAFPDHIIVATDISQEVEKISDDRVVGMVVDVTDENSIQKLRTKLEDQGILVWAIINNAGISDFFPVSEKEKAALDRIFAVNTFGPVNMVRGFLPHLIENKGRVVNISSESIRLPAAFHPYADSKIAMESLSVSMRNELALFGIKLITIRPGAINTGFLDDLHGLKNRIGDSLYADFLQNFANRAPKQLRRIAEPHEVAEVVVRALIKPKPKRYYHVNNNPVLRIAQYIPHRLRDYLMARMLRDS